MSKAFEQSVEDIAGALNDLQGPWDKRLKALEKLQSLIISADEEEWTSEITLWLKIPLKKQLVDLRSSIVREAGKALQIFATTLGDGFAPLLLALMPTLLEMVCQTNKVIIGYLHETLTVALTHTVVRKSIPMIIELFKESKSAGARERMLRYANVIFMEWGEAKLSRYGKPLTEMIKLGLNDASSEARAVARICFGHFSKIFPDQAERMLIHLDSRTQKLLRQAENGDAPVSTPSRDKYTRSQSARKFNRSSSKQTPRKASTMRTPLNSTGRRSARGTRSTAKEGFSRSRARLPRSSAPAQPNSPPAEDPWRKSKGEQTDEGSPDTDIKVGDFVEILSTTEDRRIGQVRFLGYTEFASGQWAGIELVDCTGRNDGTVQGVRYFTCEDKYGVFVRRESIRKIDSTEFEKNTPPSLPAANATHSLDDSNIEIDHFVESDAEESHSSEMEATPLAQTPQQLGYDILASHRKHIDDVLDTLKAEMEMLAIFEQDLKRSTIDEVRCYVAAIKEKTGVRKQLQQRMSMFIKGIEARLEL